MGIDTPTLIVLCGLPGSGKTTSIETFRNNPKWFIYSTDDYIELKAKEQECSYSDVFDEHIKNATKEMNSQLQGVIAENKNVLWDQTNLTTKKRLKILRKFTDYYKVCWYFPVYTENYGKWFNRLADRHGKVVPSKIIKEMIAKFDAPSLEEGYDAIFYKETGL